MAITEILAGPGSLQAGRGAFHTLHDHRPANCRLMSGATTRRAAAVSQSAGSKFGGRRQKNCVH
nr:unnamed protein product [Digitaria exilis]